MFLLRSHGKYFTLFDHLLGKELDIPLGHPLI